MIPGDKWHLLTTTQRTKVESTIKIMLTCSKPKIDFLTFWLVYVLAAIAITPPTALGVLLPAGFGTAAAFTSWVLIRQLSGRVILRSV